MRRYPAAPKRDIKSIRRWHGHWDNVAIDDHEQAYLKEEEDLICIAQYEKVPLRRLIDSSQALRTLPIWLDKKKQVPDYDAEAVSYYSDARIDAFASLAIAVVGMVMLVAPVWVLQALGDNTTAKMVSITVFVLVCLVVVSFAMVAKPFEALGTTAAYAAVLMVFLQLGASSS